MDEVCGRVLSCQKASRAEHREQKYISWEAARQQQQQQQQQQQAAASSKQQPGAGDEGSHDDGQMRRSALL
jgi:hypothetical protein